MGAAEAKPVPTAAAAPAALGLGVRAGDPGGTRAMKECAPGNAWDIMNAMRILAAGVLAGTLLVQRSAALDGLAAAGGLGLLILLGMRLVLAQGLLRDQASRRGVGIAITALAALAAGTGWAAWRAEVRLGDELAGSLEGVELQ